EPRVRPEHETRSAANDARVEVRHRHGRGPHRRLAVHLREVLGDELWLIGAVELSAHGEAAVSLGLFDARLLQQRERTAPCADEDKLGVDARRSLADRAPQLEAPGSVAQLTKPRDLLVR